MNITKASAVYTGGGIWLFHGELDDGTYFLTDDNGCTQILDEDPSKDFDESLYLEWQQAHLVRDLDDETERVDFCNKLCDKMLDTKYGDADRGGIFDNEIEEYRQFFSEPL